MIRVIRVGRYAESCTFRDAAVARFFGNHAVVEVDHGTQLQFDAAADGQSVWQDESYDHWIRDRDEFRATVYYVEQNPVSAGLVESADQWPWSSAAHL